MQENNNDVNCAWKVSTLIFYVHLELCDDDFTLLRKLYNVAIETIEASLD